MKRLTLTLAATLLLAAPSTALAQDEGDAGMPAPTCLTDDDCTGSFGVDGRCFDGYCAWAATPQCASDSDCPADQLCRYGACEDKAGYCKTDADCGPYQACHVSKTTTPVPMPTEPAMPPEDGSSDATDPMPGGTEPAPMPVPIEEEEAWGRCRMDLDAIAEAPVCRTLCEQAAACAPTSATTSSATATSSSTEPMPSSGSGSASSDDVPPSADGTDAAPPRDGSEPVPMPIEDDSDMPSGYDVAECVALCSYTVAVDVATTELDALVGCVDGATCEAIEQTCEPQAQAWIETIADDDAVAWALGGSGSLSDASAGSLTGPIEEATGANVQGADASEDVAMGCSGGGAGSTPSALMLALLALGLLARRRAA